MKFTKVSYSKVFPLGAYTNERIGAEIELGEGEDPKQGLADMKAMVEEFHKQANPWMYSEQHFETEQIVDSSGLQNIPPPQKEKSLEELIRESTTQKMLNSYRLLVYAKSTPKETKELYEEKLRELIKNK